MLARIERSGDKAVVVARHGNLLATSFHPELSGDDRFHRFFLTLRGNHRQRITLPTQTGLLYL